MHPTGAYFAHKPHIIPKVTKALRVLCRQTTTTLDGCIHGIYQADTGYLEIIWNTSK